VRGGGEERRGKRYSGGGDAREAKACAVAREGTRCVGGERLRHARSPAVRYAEAVGVAAAASTDARVEATVRGGQRCVQRGRGGCRFVGGGERAGRFAREFSCGMYIVKTQEV